MNNQVSGTGLSVWWTKTFSTSFPKITAYMWSRQTFLKCSSMGSVEVLLILERIKSKMNTGLWLDEIDILLFFQEQKHVSQWSHMTYQKCTCRVLKKFCYFPKSNMVILASRVWDILHMFSWATAREIPKMVRNVHLVKCCCHTFRSSSKSKMAILVWLAKTYSICYPELLHGKASDCQQCPLECYFSELF